MPIYNTELTKNVEESFTIKFSTGVATAPNQTINMVISTPTVASPTDTTKKYLPESGTVNFSLSPLSVEATGDAEIQGPTQVIAYVYNDDDCYLWEHLSTFYTTGNTLTIGGTIIERGNEPDITEVPKYYTAWIPFQLNVPQGKTITSATLDLTVSISSGGYSYYPLRIKAACDASSVNAVKPTSYSDLNSRWITSAETYYESDSQHTWVDGETISLDVTDTVQEAINWSAWVANNRLAILIRRWWPNLYVAEQIHSSRAGHDEAVLTVNYMP